MTVKLAGALTVGASLAAVMLTVVEAVPVPAPAASELASVSDQVMVRELLEAVGSSEELE